MLFWQKNGFLVDRHAWQFHLVSTLGSSQMSPLPCLTHLVWNFVLCKILICLRYCVITNVLNMFWSLFLFTAICKEQVFVYLFGFLLCGQDNVIQRPFLLISWWLWPCWEFSGDVPRWHCLGFWEDIMKCTYLSSPTNPLFWLSGALLLLLLMKNPKALWLILETGS